MASPPRLGSPILSLADIGSSPPVQRKRCHSDGRPDASKRHRCDHEYGSDASQTDGNTGKPVTTDDLLRPSIVIRAHPPHPLAKPYTLLPLMLLPREHLPLSCLDLAAPAGDLPTSRLFEAQIRILALETSMRSSNVLLARAPSSAGAGSGHCISSSSFGTASSIFAVECDADGLYVLCKLGSWVDVRQLSLHATAICRQRMPSAIRAATSAVTPALLTAREHKAHGRRRLAIAELQSAVRRRSQPQRAVGTAEITVGATTPAETAPAAAMTPAATDAPLAGIPSHSEAPTPALLLPSPPSPDAQKVSPETVSEPLTAKSIWHNIRTQYFEALYHSMGSLAYFAKGPLSRARASFHADGEAGLEMDDLVAFLKSLILSTTLIDKKYRETIPELVACLRTLGGDASDVAAAKRPRQLKTIKLGRSGLYTHEDLDVRRWWDVHRPPSRDDEVFPRPEAVKYTISCLRTRETQLQMILILEVLALEALQEASRSAESQRPGMPPSRPSAASQMVTSRKRNKQNLPVLLDVHADRLCIWQSTMSDDVRALAESQSQHSQAAATTTTTAGGAGALATTLSVLGDPLKEFCVDVIVPFFSPRLPLICDALNRKLGGPVLAPPSTRSAKSSKPSSLHSAHASRSSLSKSSSAKPGAATVRRTGLDGHRSTRSLERVLSNERLRRSVSRGPNDAIAQMRSATAAPIPGLKREASEPSLAQIPPLMPLKRLERGVSEITQISAAVSTSDDPRARKKAQVAAELQAAISALKKPNRELAGKAAVEAAEKRFLAGHSRRPKKPVRPMPTIEYRVQVQATPVRNRLRDVFESTTMATTVATASPVPVASAAATPVRTRGGAAVPDSAIRTGMIVAATPSKPPAAPAATTSSNRRLALARAAASSSSSSDSVLDHVPASSLLQDQASAVLSAKDDPVVPSSPLGQRMGGSRADVLLGTPTKPVGGGILSLYQQMGWDDDIDDLA